MGIIDRSLEKVILSPSFQVGLALLPTIIPTPAERDRADRLAWEADGGDPEEYPGPTWRGDIYEPSIEEEAEAIGFALGLDGERTAGPGDSSILVSYAFGYGHETGLIERERRMDEMFADAAVDRYHPCEVVEAIGAVEARRIG